jgi:pyruvate/2-oxoglutarate dehydrogenase complex dihydrolipoamide dehydrogenase (E3) component
MIVIGGGAAGLTAAGMSALLGAKTALIERRRLGGDCTWYGCVPSKTLLRAAKAAHQIRTADRFGLDAGEPRFDFATVMHHVRQTRQRIYEDADAPPNMERLGVEVVTGSARFLDSYAIEVDSASGVARRMTARFFVIATGSRPRTADFPETVLTNESIFELSSLPGRLMVVGAGPVGIELAQAFARLGSAVTVLARGDRILKRDDPEHAELVQECLRREGVAFHFGQKPGGFEGCDAVLAAIGREPSIEGLNTAAAGVRVGDAGIIVDRHCRTSQRHIYAVGDVTGRYQFTHMAEHMSKVAVTNAILRWPKRLDERHVVWSTFTDPELAHLGESETQLRERNARYTVLRFPFEKLDRAVTDAETVGEVKVFAGASGRILGASIVGASAGEMISEYALAMRHGLRLSHIADTIHPYPTFILGNRRAADRFVEKQLDSPLLGLLGRVLRYRGERRGSAALQDETDRHRK